MKKQAVAFFTMFSIIMLLSIYYISLPTNSNSTKKDVSVVNEVDNTNDNTDEELNNEIISDNNSSDEQKQEAVIKNDTIEENEKLEEEYSNIIKALGYDNNVSIKNKTIYIIIQNTESDPSIASSVMKEIYKKSSSNFFIEVSFNS